MKPAVLLATALIFCAEALAGQPELPRAFGALSLGMSEAQVSALGIEFADGCPGCVNGERYASFLPEHPSELIVLGTDRDETEEAFLFLRVVSTGSLFRVARRALA
jgi:hypothetical protein